MLADRDCEKRMEELAQRADRTGIPQVTGFLTPAEQEQARISANKAAIRYASWGGATNAERRIFVFSDCQWKDPWPIVCLQIDWHKTQAGKIGHRDVLGSILALGIKREKIGDIYVGREAAHALVHHDVSKYIEANLIRIGAAGVSVSVADQPPDFSAAEGDAQCVTVSSLRLDALISRAFSISRKQSEEWVESGRVQVDHQVELRKDRVVAADMMISIRGLGRVKLLEIIGKTKKDRLRVTLMRY